MRTNTSVLLFAAGPPPGTKGSPGVGVAAVRRSTDNGASWSAAELLPEWGRTWGVQEQGGQLQSWPQVLHDPATDSVLAFFHRPQPSAAPGSCAATCSRHVARSTDEGR